MTKPFPMAFKQKMVQRLTGNRCSECIAAGSTRQGSGSRTCRAGCRRRVACRSWPITPKPAVREWTVEQKARVLADASDLDGEALTAYLEREGVKLAEYEQWRIALDEGGRASA